MQKTLKALISRYMYLIACILICLILVMLITVQILLEQNWEYRHATKTIKQIAALLEENREELTELEEAYTQTCIHNAETVARIIEGNPDVIKSVEEMNEIAELVEIDEIHIIDKTGRIYAGTHPKYYELSFDSGEQMMFFKPMLRDKSLKLVQEITPNTAEEKPMQYSAVWSKYGEFIVQVGMEPVNVMKVTEKNELPYIVSLLGVNTEADYYAIDVSSGEIAGSTDLNLVGHNISEIGLAFRKVQNDSDGFYAKVNGSWSFCLFEKCENNYIGKVTDIEYLYRRIPDTMVLIFICLTAVVVILVHAVVKYMNRYVVMKIDDINERLKLIADGNLDKELNVQSSQEFAELSRYINMMIKSLLDNNRKISYALSKTNMHIGTYEYHIHAGRVRYTDYIPQIFSLEQEEMERLAENFAEFVVFLDKLKASPIADETGLYQYGKRYIRLEEVRKKSEVFGVVIDVTAEIEKRLELKKERDMDILTGLYNRLGLDDRLAELFLEPEKLGCHAICLIDADGLKSINDTYGHERGDIYLQKIAQLISEAGTKNKVASRMGGDEFVLFLYGYETKSALMKDIEALKSVQSGIMIEFEEDIKVMLRFSLGYCLSENASDYHAMIRKADEKMYENKLQRRNSEK